MRRYLKLLWGALLLLPVVCLAKALVFHQADMSPLLAWSASLSGVSMATVLLVLGATVGAQVGPPTALIEGTALAGFIQFVPPILVRCHCPSVVQNALSWLLVAWTVTFIAMFLRFFDTRWNDWQMYSFLVQPRAAWKLLGRWWAPQNARHPEPAFDNESDGKGD